MIDVARSGVLMDKTPTIVRNLISNMASNTQQFWTRGAAASRGVNEEAVVDSQRLENKITELTSLLSDNIIRVYQQKCVAFVLLRSTQLMRAPHYRKLSLVPTNSSTVFNLKIQFHTKHASKPKQLPITDSQIPSITFPTTATTTGATTGQFSFVGRVDEAVGSKQHRVSEKFENKQHAFPTKYECHDLGLENTKGETSHHNESTTINQFWTPSLPNNCQSKREREQINIPLLEAIKKILKYAKFLKELCIHKRKKLKEGVEMGRIISTLIKSEQVVAIMQLAMLAKCRGPGIFSVPCTIIG
ncbi:hypothetical protein CR513_02960, partial [Mucuna pruriens]